MPNQETDTEQVDVDTQIPFQEDPPIKKLYNGLVKEQLYTKSFDDFQKQFSTPDAIKKLHNGLSSQQLYTKSSDEFQRQYFPETVKKKDGSPLPALDGKLPVSSDSQIPIVDLSSKHKFLSGVFDVADENTPEPTQPAKQTSFFQGLANTLQKGKQEIDRRNDPVVKTKNAQDFVKNLLQEKGINIDVDKEMDNPNLAPELGVLYNDTNKELEGQDYQNKVQNLNAANAGLTDEHHNQFDDSVRRWQDQVNTIMAKYKIKQTGAQSFINSGGALGNTIAGFHK